MSTLHVLAHITPKTRQWACKILKADRVPVLQGQAVCIPAPFVVAVLPSGIHIARHLRVTKILKKISYAHVPLLGFPDQSPTKEQHQSKMLRVLEVRGAPDRGPT